MKHVERSDTNKTAACQKLIHFSVNMQVVRVSIYFMYKLLLLNCTFYAISFITLFLISSFRNIISIIIGVFYGITVILLTFSEN